MFQVDQFNQALGKCKQSLNALILPHDINDKSEAAELIVTKGRVEFLKVKFHYHGTDPLFKNKSVVIESGQKIGLMGYSGSGKTTFVNLILRLYEVTGGKIIIDGQDIREVTQENLRRTIALIPQDPTLFHRS